MEVHRQGILFFQKYPVVISNIMDKIRLKVKTFIKNLKGDINYEYNRR